MSIKVSLFPIAFFWLIHLSHGQEIDSVYRISNIYVIGNEKTKEAIILRELSLEKDSLYSEKEIATGIEDGEKRIYNTNLFNEVEIQLLKSSPNEADLMVKVVERWYFYPAPIFRIVDRNFMDWLVNRSGGTSRINSGLRVSKFNFRGRNEQIRFLAEVGLDQGSIIRKRFILNYAVPYIEKSQRYGLIFDLAYTEAEDVPYLTIDHLPTLLKTQTNNRVAFNSLTTLSYRPSYYSKHFLSAGFKNTNISDTLVSINPNYLGESRTRQKVFRLKYQFVNDLRNKVNFPTSGHYLNFFIEKKGLGIYKDLNQLTFFGTYSRYKELGNNFFLANNVTGLATFPADQPYFNYWGLGYDEIFGRGFELVVIEGQKFILQKNSVRKLLLDRKWDYSDSVISQFNNLKLALYAKLFFDVGWVDNYPNYTFSDRLTNKFLYSAGLGIDMVTIYDLVLRFEYSYNSASELNFALNIKADM